MKTTILTSMLVLIAAALFTGCQEYEVDVTVEADGGGRRHVTLVSDSKIGDEGGEDCEKFMRLFAIDPAFAWVRADLRPDSTDASWPKFGRTRPLASREVAVKRLDDWHRNSGDITIRAWPGAGRFAGVRFSNEVSVETGETATGRSITYRETFTWTGLREVIANRQANCYARELEAMYPRMSPEQEGEIRGIVKGAMLMEIELSLREADKEDHGNLVDTITDFVMEVLEEEAGRDFVRELTHRILVDPESELTDWIEEEMPGVDLAVMTDIALRVTMPGRILDTNAETLEGDTAKWSVDVTEAILRPVEIYVRCEVAR